MQHSDLIRREEKLLLVHSHENALWTFTSREQSQLSGKCDSTTDSQVVVAHEFYHEQAGDQSLPVQQLW